MSRPAPASPRVSATTLVCLAVTALAFAPARAAADVTGVVITSCVEILGGRSFGEVGAYEKCVGKIHFALDPAGARNRVIVDLDKAPVNADGLVEFSSDIWVLRPKDPSRGNGVLFFDVINRGNKLLLGRFNFAAGAVDPTTEAEFGGRVPHARGLYARRGGVGADAEHPCPLALSPRRHRRRPADHGRGDELVHPAPAVQELRSHIVVLDRVRGVPPAPAGRPLLPADRAARLPR